MAIYRPPRQRWPQVAGALVVGILIGVVIGWALRGEGGDPAEAVATVRSGMAEAAGLLEVAGIEYSEAVDGATVVETELSGAQDAVARSRELYDEVSEALALMDPEAADQVEAAYDETVALMDATADAAEVMAALEDLRALLT